MSAGEYQPTLQDIAKAEARRLKKEQAKRQKAAAAKIQDPRGNILPREWAEISGTSPGQTTRVMTWNILAQTLVRRELFPSSDCLKASQREHMLYHEILSHNATICCLQEVDRTEKLFPELKRAGYAWVYAAGPRKKHGLLIAYRADAFAVTRQRVVAYDEQDVRSDGECDSTARRGMSFRTKNIASLVALRKLDGGSDGVIVATTHLFWHPAYTYERARQAGVLLREVSKFRAEGGDAESRWPCIIAGDFNFPPDDAAYSLLVGDPLLPAQAQRLATSRVVHSSVDPSVLSTTSTAEDEGEGGEGDPDHVIVNARAAQPADGLLTDAELEDLFKVSATAAAAVALPTSVYDAGLRLAPEISGELTFGSRVAVPSGRRGGYEPVYTSYTHYWQAVLDYIFVLDPPGRNVSVARLAKPHPKEAFGSGLPLKGVCGSDHISLAADLCWPAPT